MAMWRLRVRWKWLWRNSLFQRITSKELKCNYHRSSKVIPMLANTPSNSNTSPLDQDSNGMIRSLCLGIDRVSIRRFCKGFSTSTILQLMRLFRQPIILRIISRFIRRLMQIPVFLWTDRLTGFSRPEYLLHPRHHDNSLYLDLEVQRDPYWNQREISVITARAMGITKPNVQASLKALLKRNQ